MEANNRSVNPSNRISVAVNLNAGCNMINQHIQQEYTAAPVCRGAAGRGGGVRGARAAGRGFSGRGASQSLPHSRINIGSVRINVTCVVQR